MIKFSFTKLLIYIASRMKNQSATPTIVCQILRCQLVRLVSLLDKRKNLMKENPSTNCPLPFDNLQVQSTGEACTLAKCEKKNQKTSVRQRTKGQRVNAQAYSFPANS
jgi:hypothetical protein